MAGIQSETRRKRDAIIDALPDHGWAIGPAAQSVGYSKTYAYKCLPAILAKDELFCCQVLRKRQSLEALTQDRRVVCLERLSGIIDGKGETTKDRISAIREEASICGWHKETTVIETEERIGDLDDARADLARRAAIAVFDTTKALPGDEDSIECDVVDVVDVTRTQGRASPAVASIINEGVADGVQSGLEPALLAGDSAIGDDLSAPHKGPPTGSDSNEGKLFSKRAPMGAL